ncbi:hypothetical protein, partial, partial [Parasitella parasitica]
MDILSKLGIRITGLVSRHGFETGPRLPDPIDGSIHLNTPPYGSDDEREPFLNSLQELLVQNSLIDMKNTACNLPDSVIKLNIVPGIAAWRAQYPLPEAYREIVAKQIKIWLDEGVIVRSASHTPNLKEAPTMALVISPPDFKIRIHLATNASLSAIGGMFLIYLNTQEVPNAMMLGWWETFCSYTFDIAHLPGIFNVIPDALSGLYEDDADVSARHLLAGRYYADGDELIKRKKKSSSKLKTASASKVKMKRAPARVTKLLRSASDSDSSKPVAVKAIPLRKSDITSAASKKLHEELILRALCFADYITPPTNERYNMIISQHLVGHFGIKHVENAFHKEDKWWVDLGDMGVKSTFGNKFSFVLTDLFTRFTVIRSKQLTSDRGAEFVNQIIDIGGIDRRLVLAYNPLGNSTAESYIKLTKATTIKWLN